MSYLLGACDALASALNAQSFSLPFTAERKIMPVRTAEDLTTGLKVSVTPLAGQMELISDTRGNGTRTLRPTIVIVQRFPETEANDDAPFEPLIDLMEEFIGFVMTGRGRLLEFTHKGDAVRVSRIDEVENEPSFDPDYLHQMNVFWSELTLNYRLG